MMRENEINNIRNVDCKKENRKECVEMSRALQIISIIIIIFTVAVRIGVNVEGEYNSHPRLTWADRTVFVTIENTIIILLCFRFLRTII